MSFNIYKTFCVCYHNDKYIQKIKKFEKEKTNFHWIQLVHIKLYLLRISWCLVHVLTLAGTDTFTFTRHSARAASTFWKKYNGREILRDNDIESWCWMLKVDSFGENRHHSILIYLKRRFYEMKWGIPMGDRSALMGNSNFVRKIEAEYIMTPPHPTQKIYLILLPLFYRSCWLLWLSWKKSKILEEDCNHNHERKRGQYSSKQNCYLIPTTFVVCQNKHILDFFITFIRSAFDLPRVLPFCCGLPVF